MHASTLKIIAVLQILCWGLVLSAMQSNPTQANAYLQTTTPSPFLREIYYGQQDVWQIFDHNLPVASSGNDDNDDVTHYDGVIYEAVTITPDPNIGPTPTNIPPPDPYIPDEGYGYDEHGGIDFSLQYEPVLAAAEGIVRLAGWVEPANPHHDRQPNPHQHEPQLLSRLVARRTLVPAARR